MNDYKQKLYLSSSWHNTDYKQSKCICELLAQKGFLMVSDHPIFKNEVHPRNLSYACRVSEIMLDCVGLVIILPYRNNKHTTSPYMILELAFACKFNIPILLLASEKVKIDVKDDPDSISFTFGSNKTLQETKLCDLLSLNINDCHFNDKLLENNYKYNFEYENTINLYTDLPKEESDILLNKIKIVDKIDSFIDKILNEDKKILKYFFNIIAYSNMKSHEKISKIILEETGLCCHISRDFHNNEIRNKNIEYIKNSTYVLSDISELRPTCIYEVGLAKGMKKDQSVLSNHKTKKLPFGIDDFKINYYKNSVEFEAIIREICKPYKVKVFNCEIEKKETRQDLSGMPDWYFYDNINSYNKTIILLSIVTFVLLYIILVVSLPNNLISNILSAALSIIGFIVTCLPKVQQYIQRKVFRETK